MNSLSYMQAYAEATSTVGTLSVSTVDVIMYIFVALFLVIVAFLSYTQIKTSRRLEELSDETIHAERLRFDKRVGERARALVRSEEQRLTELDRTAKFGQLSQGLFHDLINPLAAITIYAEEMDRGDPINERSKDMISKMLSTSKRLGSYMESVRRCLETDQAQPVETSDFWYEAGIVRDVVAYKARRAGIEIIFENESSLKLPIHPVRLHQILLNLVMNGIDACIEKLAQSTHEETMKVTVSVHDTGNAIAITVADTGIGMSSATQNRLFKESFTTKEKGTGIGLMTIKNIVERDLKGSIDVQSEEGKATKFIIRIPSNGQ